MTVAMVAQLDLLSSSPEILAKAEEILSSLGGRLTHGLASDFVGSACWADDISYYNLTAFLPWHFIDQPYNPQGMLAPRAREQNVLGALNNAVNTVRKQTVGTAPFETSFMLRFLIHFVGDIHQPLHDVSL